MHTHAMCQHNMRMQLCYNVARFHERRLTNRGGTGDVRSGQMSPRGSVSKDDHLLSQWSELESAHARVSEALERALQREHQLSVSEYEVLRRLVAAPKGHRRIQELADEIHLSQSALSRLVGRLEDAGYVSRATCDYDRRGIFACITDAGRKAQDEAHPTHLAVLAETLAEHRAVPASERRDAYVRSRGDEPI